MSLCLSAPYRRRETRAATSSSATLADMIGAARKAIVQRGELDERDLELAGFTAEEIAEHREAVLARLRRERRGLDA